MRPDGGAYDAPPDSIAGFGVGDGTRGGRQGKGKDKTGRGIVEERGRGKDTEGEVVVRMTLVTMHRCCQVCFW